MIKLVPDPPLTLEDNLLRASELLRCAAAVAYESSDQHSGKKRDLAFSVMYLVDMAKALIDDSPIQVEARQPS